MDAGILTLTLNPCLDKTLWRETWDGPVVRTQTQSGGKGLNVARVLSALGEDCLAVTALGGDAGRECADLARKEGIRLMTVDSGEETRVIVTEALVDTYEQRQHYVSGRPLPGEVLSALENMTVEAMEGRRIFCLCGTAPDEKSAALGAALLCEAKRRGLMTVLDSRGEALRLGMEAAPDIIKPNEVEFDQLMGRHVEPDETFSAAEELAGRGLVVLLTLGDRGAVCAADGNLYCAPAEKGKAVNPVGCGDTFLAAWLHARIQGRDQMDSLRFACHTAARSASVWQAAFLP